MASWRRAVNFDSWKHPMKCDHVCLTVICSVILKVIQSSCFCFHRIQQSDGSIEALLKRLLIKLMKQFLIFVYLCYFSLIEHTDRSTIANLLVSSNWNFLTEKTLARSLSKAAFCKFSITYWWPERHIKRIKDSCVFKLLNWKFSIQCSNPWMIKGFRVLRIRSSFGSAIRCSAAFKRS